MAYRLRSEGQDFADRAPVRLVFARELTAPRSAVFQALAEEPDAWPLWWPDISRCSYRGEGPHGTGTVRLVRLRAGTRFTETVVAWDEGSRFAYRVDTASAPGLRALVEEWRLMPGGAGGTGTRVQWTFAADAPVPVRLLLRAAQPGLARSFRGAVTRLDRHLTAV